MILLVSHEGDDHLAPVLAELGRIGSESVVVDTSQIPSTMAMSAVHSSTGDNWRLRMADGSWLDLGQCRSGWWRRALPAGPDARIADPVQASWAANETYEAMSGFWDALPITWVSPPRAILTSMMKTWQLPAARSAGLVVPETLVTSDPDEARAFIDRVGLGRVICKAFSATMENWRETRMIGAGRVRPARPGLRRAGDLPGVRAGRGRPAHHRGRGGALRRRDPLPGARLPARLPAVPGDAVPVCG